MKSCSFSPVGHFHSAVACSDPSSMQSLARLPVQKPGSPEDGERETTGSDERRCRAAGRLVAGPGTCTAAPTARAAARGARTVARSTRVAGRRFRVARRRARPARRTSGISARSRSIFRRPWATAARRSETAAPRHAPAAPTRPPAGAARVVRPRTTWLRAAGGALRAADHLAPSCRPPVRHLKCACQHLRSTEPELRVTVLRSEMPLPGGGVPLLLAAGAFFGAAGRRIRGPVSRRGSCTRSSPSCARGSSELRATPSELRARPPSCTRRRRAARDAARTAREGPLRYRGRRGQVRGGAPPSTTLRQWRYTPPMRRLGTCAKWATHAASWGPTLES